jgi:hypothetical protein
MLKVILLLELITVFCVILSYFFELPLWFIWLISVLIVVIICFLIMLILFRIFEHYYSKEITLTHIAIQVFIEHGYMFNRFRYLRHISSFLFERRYGPSIKAKFTSEKINLSWEKKGEEISQDIYYKKNNVKFQKQINTFLNLFD